VDFYKTEYLLIRKLKYAGVAIFFGCFGLHRFMRKQYVSGFLFMLLFGLSVIFIGNPSKTVFVTITFIIVMFLVLIDALCMIIKGRFYLDETYVKIDVSSSNKRI
jgi:TM2 domain-containing membrane protein YozV